MPGYELRIIDEDGRVLEGPAVGNLEVRGDSCAAFYWHQHEKTKACMRGDWFTTGDRYERREDGAYVFVGPHRRDAQGRRPVGLPHRHGARDRRAPARSQAAGVVGVMLDDASRIAAFVERRSTRAPDDALAEELRAMCKERLRRYEYPHVVHFVDELPRTPSGKVQRFKLRTLAAEGSER